MLFLRYFGYVLAASLLSALIGGAFGGFLGWLSPDFVASLFCPPQGTALINFAAAVGAVWGIFIGAAVMGFCIGVASVVQISRAIAQKGSNGAA